MSVEKSEEFHRLLFEVQCGVDTESEPCGAPSSRNQFSLLVKPRICVRCSDFIDLALDPVEEHEPA